MRKVGVVVSLQDGFPSLFIYAEGKLLNYLCSLEKTEITGNIYSFGIRQVNILYYYITHTTCSTLAFYSTPPPSRRMHIVLSTIPGVQCHT